MLRENLLKNICYICGQLPIWNNKILVLTIDHINGIRNDNRLINLRMLCPNCHSQTETFSGKNKKYLSSSNIKNNRNIRASKNCTNCDRKISHKSITQLCYLCYSLVKVKKVERPDMNFLIEELNVSNFTQVSKKYGVSDNAIRKWLKAEGIDPKQS